MTILDKIKLKVIHIDIDELVERLNIELRIPKKEEKDEEETSPSVDSQKLLEYAIYDTLLIILDVTHLKKIDDSLYSIWINMIKDYWFLNKYDSLIKSNDSEEDDETSDNMEVSSIKTGDTTVNFSSKSNMIDINGTKYSTGTIDFDKNILVEKYKQDLYRHRRLRWS